MNRFISNTPRPVLIAIAVILGALVLSAVLVPVLGGARDNAFAENRRLLDEIQATKKAIVQAKDDLTYVNENAEAYEALLKGDRLLPHTRRAAIVRLEEVARAQGLTSLSYGIRAVAANAAKSVSTQPTSNAYHVSIENIELKVGAPIDGSIYRFLVDISESFPGGVVLETLSLKRAPAVSEIALRDVSSGRDAKLVEGELTLSWRTAQAKEKEGEQKK